MYLTILTWPIASTYKNCPWICIGWLEMFQYFPLSNMISSTTSPSSTCTLCTQLQNSLEHFSMLTFSESKSQISSYNSGCRPYQQRDIVLFLIKWWDERTTPSLPRVCRCTELNKAIRVIYHGHHLSEPLLYLQLNNRYEADQFNLYPKQSCVDN